MASRKGMIEGNDHLFSTPALHAAPSTHPCLVWLEMRTGGLINA